MMETKWIQPVLEVNKFAFQGWYQAVSSMQDQAEKMMHNSWEQVPVVPESSKQLLSQWVKLCKKERENLKKTVDQGFETFEKFMAGPENKAEPEKQPEEKSEEKEEKGGKSKSATSKTASS